VLSSTKFVDEISTKLRTRRTGLFLADFAFEGENETTELGGTVCGEDFADC
jgi:hypothetical protein